jgi:hypothetical protein
LKRWVLSFQAFLRLNISLRSAQDKGDIAMEDFYILTLSMLLFPNFARMPKVSQKSFQDAQEFFLDPFNGFLIVPGDFTGCLINVKVALI